MMVYETEKLLRAKLFWYTFKLTKYSLKGALCTVNEIQDALDGKRYLCPAYSQLLVNATARQYSEKELADLTALYERITNGWYSGSIADAILGLEEKEDKQ